MAARDARLAPPAFDRRTGAAVALAAFALSGHATALAHVVAAAGRHLAFFAPGLVAFALAGGCLAVLLAPRGFAPGRVRDLLAALALAGAAGVLVVPALTLPTAGTATLGALAAAAALPCAAGGAIAALALGGFPGSIPRVFAWGLGGAAGGVFAAAAAVIAAGPPVAPGPLAAAGALAAVLFAPGGARALRIAAALAAALGLAMAAFPVSAPRGGQREAARSVRGRTAFAGWDAGVFLAARPLPEGGARDALAVSRAFAGQVPEALALAVDGAGRAPVVRHGEGDDHAWGRWTLGALPHLLRPGAETLLVSAGGGRDILVALASGASRVRAVEETAAVVALVQGALGSFSGRPYSLDGVEAAVGDGRSWLARDRAHYGVVRVELAGVPPGDAGGFAEERLATVEALHEMLSRLQEEGILALDVAVADPALPRVLAAARRALGEGGVADPAAHLLAAARGPLATVLVCRRAFAAEEALALERLGEALGYEVLLSPRAERGGALHDARRASARRYAAADAGGSVAPATDDRPYPHSDLRPGDLLRPAPARFPGDRGALRLRSALLGAAALVLLLVLLPLCRGVTAPLGAGPPLAAGAFFAALSLGLSLFAVLLARELAALSRGAAFGGALVTGCLLAGAAAGSLRVRGNPGPPAALRTRCGALAIVLLLVAVSLPALREIALPWPAAARLVVAAALASAVGLLASQALTRATVLAAGGGPGLVPWACCLAGLSGAIGAWLAPLLAVGVGHTSALMVGPACCLVAVAVAELL